MREKTAVIGAGSWGTALSKLLAEKGHEVTLWAHEPEVAEGINRSHANPLFLPDIPLPGVIRATSDLKEALSGRSLVVSVVPSHALRAVWEGAAAHLDGKALLVSCTKGIEQKGLKLMSQVLTECLPGHPPALRTVLSGPSFAREVAAGQPTSVVIAGTDQASCRRVQELFRTDGFLTFTSADPVGVEVGGAVKNVIAVASGITDGMKLGFNARASLITRGLYEMIKIGRALGADPLTFAGLSGIGDLVLTCTEGLSRNHRVGKKLGEGEPLEAIEREMKAAHMVAEGIPTAKAVRDLGAAHRLNIPICDCVYRILFEGLSPADAIKELCSLTLKDEMGALQGVRKS